MSSLPESYRPTPQTITASEQASKLTGGQSQQMKPDDLIVFLIEEGQHWVINDECTKNAETALAAHGKKGGKKGSRKGKKPAKSEKEKSDETCGNVEKPVIKHLIAGSKEEARKGRVQDKRKSQIKRKP